MRCVSRATTVAAALVLLATTAGAQGAKPLKKCPVDSVISGTVCMDKYEASVWQVPNALGSNKGLVKNIQAGKATQADLIAGGAAQRGVATDDYTSGFVCTDDGAFCLNSLANMYAVSLPGVKPSANLTWFQANAFCAASKKRLPTNAEWQAAASMSGSGADTNCNVSSGGTQDTGSNPDCNSPTSLAQDNAYDMTGNVAEWVADWVPQSTGCPGWGAFSNDFMCLSGASTTGLGPGALLRGGDFFLGTAAGPLAVIGVGPSSAGRDIGFRRAR